jgi:hypothetical protein
MSDAAVALRSLPRRFREIVAGPEGDQAWDRLIRTLDASGRSALGYVVHTTAEVTALGTAIAALPLTARPSVSLAAIEKARSDVPQASTVAELTAQLEQAAVRGADAIHGRQHGDFDRNCIVDDAELSARDLVNHVVAFSVANLRHAQAALDAAKSRH